MSFSSTETRVLQPMMQELLSGHVVLSGFFAESVAVCLANDVFFVDACVPA